LYYPIELNVAGTLIPLDHMLLQNRGEAGNIHEKALEFQRIIIHVINETNSHFGSKCHVTQSLTGIFVLHSEIQDNCHKQTKIAYPVNPISYDKV